MNLRGSVSSKSITLYFLSSKVHVFLHLWSKLRFLYYFPTVTSKTQIQVNLESPKYKSTRKVNWPYSSKYKSTRKVNWPVVMNPRGGVSSKSITMYLSSSKVHFILHLWSELRFLYYFPTITPQTFLYKNWRYSPKYKSTSKVNWPVVMNPRGGVYSKSINMNILSSKVQISLHQW